MMTMTTLDPGTGIFLVAVRTAEGRIVEYDGDEDEIDFWLAEFRKADTLVRGRRARADRGRGARDLEQPGRVARHRRLRPGLHRGAGPLPCPQTTP